MKKLIFSGIVLFAAVMAIMAFNYPAGNPSGKSVNQLQEKFVSAFPEDVQKILETSCFDCHSAESSNAKAKTKMNLSKWEDMSDAKKVAKMEAIKDMLNKGDMPPGKYVSKYPERKPNQGQKDIINKWISEESARIMSN